MRPQEQQLTLFEETPVVSTLNVKKPVVQYNETAKVLRTVRKKLGLDQAEFGSTIADVDKNTVSRWERGKTKPDKLRLMWIKSNLPYDMASMLVNLKEFGDRGKLDDNKFNIPRYSKDYRESTSK